MKIFVINLEKSSERKVFMKTQLDNLCLEHEFVKGVDGRVLTAEELQKHCNMQRVEEVSYLLTPGMIGCSLSHYLVYREMIDRQIQCALILEDDAFIGPDITHLLPKLEDLLKNNTLDRYEPILLFFQNQGRVCNFTSVDQIRLGDRYSINYPINIWQPTTTAAYVVTYECARRLMDFVYPIGYSPDSWGLFHREKIIKGLRCVLPVPVESGYFKSDIGYELSSPLNNFVKMLESKNVFPVKQLLKKRRRTRAKKQHEYSIVEEGCEWKRNTFHHDLPSSKTSM